MRLRLFVIIVLLQFKLLATHIVGGELIYDYLGNNKYRITLKIYRDCGLGTAAFDGIFSGPPAVLSVIENLNSLNAYTVDVGAPQITQIPPTINNRCIATPTNICVEEGIYTCTLTLPPVEGGYYIVYQRCCRNNSIVNLFNSGDQGSTYYTKIPGPEDAAVNSSPRFKNFPPIFLCNDLDFTFDHAATDPDGDQLVYSFDTPYQGMNGCCVYIGDPNGGLVTSSCPSPPGVCPTVAVSPNYPAVTYVAPYSGFYPIASNPSLTIHPFSGLIKGHPNLLGQFVVSVCVKEFRNGILLNTHFRDFQFNISPCQVSIISSVAEQENQCMGNTIFFLNQSSSNVPNISYHWDFGDLFLTNDTSNLVNPTYTYQDTGVYVMTLIAKTPENDCTDTLRRNVYVYPPLDIKFTPPAMQCLKNNFHLFNAFGDFSPNHVSFNWNFSSTASPSVSNVQGPPGVVFNQSGLFFVKLLARQFSCRDSMIDSVRILRPPIAKIRNGPEALCSPATIRLKNGTVSDLPVHYAWQVGNGEVVNDFAPQFTFTEPGVYKISLLATTSSVCVDTSATSINNFTVLSLPVAGFEPQPESISIFDAQVTIVDLSSKDVTGWRYAFGDGDTVFAATPSHFYRDIGKFVITQIVNNKFGCRDTIKREIEVTPEFRFWIPNTFSPDGNGLNDIFKPSLFGVSEYDFLIMDRWGRKIFETNDPQEGWDGKLKGAECKQDVYAWRIVFRNTVSRKQEEKGGHVLLLRDP